MVYRGKPSAGCENCRKAKKRCGLEQPACLRCVKLNKSCSGYRDISQLQIQDETRDVVRKAEKYRVTKAGSSSPPPQPPPPPQPSSWVAEVSFAVGPASTTTDGLLTPPLTYSDSSPESQDGGILDPLLDGLDLDTIIADDIPVEDAEVASAAIDTTTVAYELGPVGAAIKVKADEIANSFFFSQFAAANGHMGLVRLSMVEDNLDPCLKLAVKACGMAALNNTRGVVMGKEYAQTMYVEALGLLNSALRDPKRCRTDESLIAVALLGFYENLSCENRQSITSWKAHIQGATQLLKLRGKAQFSTIVGQMLFREIRAQILISYLWDDSEPPSFLTDWQRELDIYHNGGNVCLTPADDMVDLCFAFAQLRARLKTHELSDTAALQLASEIETRYIQWSMDTMANVEQWRYYDIDVADSPHVWNGVVHAYITNPAPTIWNTWRCMRIMLTRTQELLCRRIDLPPHEKDEQIRYFRSTRRQMCDEICKTVPVALGHASPAYSSPCILTTAYASIWPLFFAGTCALERVGPGAIEMMKEFESGSGRATSAPFSQASWILERLEYISKTIGLRWADGVAATLRGEFEVFGEFFSDYEQTLKRSWLRKIRIEDRPPWIRRIENSRREPVVL